MSVTKWERTKAVSGQLRAVWDAKRDGVDTWQRSFEKAREAVAQRLEADLQIALAMTWDEFRRIEGWHEHGIPPGVKGLGDADHE